MLDWEQVLRDDGPPVWRTACRLLGNAHDAQDCFQDARTEVVERSNRELIQNPRALLQRVVTSRSLDRLRRRYRRKASSLSEEMDVPDSTPQPQQHLETLEMLDSLRDALAMLPENQAQAFVLHCVEDWSYQQIADHLSITPGAVGMLLLRARTRLKEALSAADGTPLWSNPR